MTDTTTFTIGAEAVCTDGDCGEVRRVIVNPVAREVTHLVVEPKGRLGLARLVPLDLVDDSAGEISLRCTLAEFAQLESAEETQFIPGSQGYAAYGPEQVLVWPYYGLGGAGAVTDAAALQGTSQTVTYDAIPLGEVEVRRGDAVQATDGDIGRVHGLVVDPGHRADRDRHLFLAPQVPLGQQHVGHVVRPRVDDQPVHAPDAAVGGLDRVAPAHVHLAQRDGVVGDGLRGALQGGRIGHRGRAAQAVVGPDEHLFRAVRGVALGPGYELGFLGGLELRELRQGAADPDLVSRGVHEVEGDEPGQPHAALRLDHQVGDLTGDRVDDHPAHLAAVPVGAAGLGPDRERLLGHGGPSW